MKHRIALLTFMLVLCITVARAQVTESGEEAGAPPLISNETPDQRRAYEFKQEARTPLSTERGTPQPSEDIPQVPEIPVVPVSAQDGAVLDSETETVQTICPVSKEKLGSMGEPVEYVHNGKVYKLCCPMCLDEFAKDPEKYIAEMEALESAGTPDDAATIEESGAGIDGDADTAEPKVIELEQDGDE